MRRKLFALLIAVLFVLTALTPVALAENPPAQTGNSSFRASYAVAGDYAFPFFDPCNNFAYNSLFVNSKGEVWMPVASGKYGTDMWMYQLDLKNEKVLKKVHIGMFNYFPLFKPSLDGRYLYFPIIKLKPGSIFIQSWNFVCFDLEEGKVVWDKFYLAAGTWKYIYATDVIPTKDGAVLTGIIDYDRGPYNEALFLMKVSNGGKVEWQNTYPYGAIIFVDVNQGKLYLGDTDEDPNYSSDNTKYTVVDLNTGKSTSTTVFSDNYSETAYPLNTGIYSSRYISVLRLKLKDKNKGYTLDNAISANWDLRVFKQSNNRNVLQTVVPHLPVRIYRGWLIFSNFISASYKGYFVFIDSPKFKDQNIYVYDENGKVLWHRDVLPTDTYRADVMPTFANGMLFYGSKDTMYAVDVKTGKDVQTLKVGNFDQCGVLSAWDSGTVWMWAFSKKDKEHIHILKLTPAKATLTVNANIKDGSFDIIQGSAKETVKFGSKVELPAGTYTLHFNGTNDGIEPPEDINIILKPDENKVLTVEYKDTEPPVLTVEPVEPPMVMNGVAYFTIKGTVKDNFSGIKSVSINGMNVTINSDGSFSGTVMVYEKGKITFNVVAEDNAGNKAEKTLTAVYNPPVVIKLKPNSKEFSANGETKTLDSPPVIVPKWNRTVVPIRAIVEALGGTIEWDPAERKVTINLSGTTIELWIGKPQAMVNGEMKWIDPNNHDVKPIIINSRTMLPLRFVAENLGCTVNWDPVTRTITITYSG